MERDRLESLLRSVPVSRRKRQAISRELHAHLEDAQRELVHAGWSEDAALAESLTRFGDPLELADGLIQVHRHSRPARLAIASALALSMVLGVYGMGGSFASARSAQHPKSQTNHPVHHHRTVRQHPHR